MDGVQPGPIKTKGLDFYSWLQQQQQYTARHGSTVSTLLHTRPNQLLRCCRCYIRYVVLVQQQYSHGLSLKKSWTPPCMVSSHPFRSPFTNIASPTSSFRRHQSPALYYTYTSYKATSGSPRSPAKRTAEKYRGGGHLSPLVPCLPS